GEIKKAPNPAKDDTEGIPKVAFIGKPNVGKSSMVNALLGVERNIVTSVAGTTRDALHSHYKAFGNEYLLIDTAGIRRKSKVHENLEFYSTLRSLKAIDEADVCVLIIDATLGIESQDMSLFTQVKESGKGLVVLVNKWDLIEKETNRARHYQQYLKHKPAPFVDIPDIFVSATDKQRIHKGMEELGKVYANLKQPIPTHALNEYLL